MRKPVLTIFYQYDPWNATIGGIQTIIGSCIKYAPEGVRLRFVGVTSTPNVEPGVWHRLSLKGREVLFMPLFRLEDDNRRHLIPTTLRYTIALMRRNLASDFMHFHRLEPSMVTAGWKGEKTLFVHNDILSQVMQEDSGSEKQKSGKQTILWRKFPKIYLALEGRLIRKFAQVLSCNSESTAFYKAQYPDMAKRVSFVRNTVDGELFYPLSESERLRERQALCARLKLSAETRFLLFAGRLHPQKDPLLLLQSFAALKRSTSEPLHLLVAGDGELLDELKAEMVRLDLEGDVSLLGPLQQSQLIELHQLSDVCVLTSRYEGLPLVVLEALACGTPVVTTRCGETPKLLSEQSGVVCDDRSPEAIADALAQVLNHPEQYPRSSCVDDSRPYEASQVVGELYQQMLSHWEARMVA